MDRGNCNIWIGRRSALGALVGGALFAAAGSEQAPVLPRDRNGFSTVSMSGATGWRLSEEDAWRSGDSAQLAAGGPYRIWFRTPAGVRTMGPLFVGDVWLLAGQSNMQGAGLLRGAVIGDERIRNFTLADDWVRAEEPLHTIWEARDPVYWVGGKPTPTEMERRRNAAKTVGASLGLPFALSVLEKTGIPMGLVPCALSGTSIAEWSPARRDESGGSLYGALLRRARKVGGRIAGVLWYQGEADGKPELAPRYKQALRELIAALRQDLRDETLPFYYIQIGRHVHDPQSALNASSWNQVQESQRLIESEVPNTMMVASVDLELDDGIHIGTDGLKELGRRLALLATGSAKRGPRPARAVWQERAIRLFLSDVNGRIERTGRLSGFTVADRRGQITPRVYRVIAEGADLVLLLDGGPTPPAYLWYGYGKDPYCNVRDSAGMALPVFGPFPIESAA